MDLKWLLPVTPYGEYWRRSRKLMHSQTHAKAAESYRPHQMRGARRLVKDLLAAEPNRPTDKLSDAAKAVLPHMVRYNFAHTALDMIYGIDVRDKAMEARFVEPAETTLHYFSQGTSPGQFLVDFIPLRESTPIPHV
jgi:cytochrome P450